MKKKNLRKNLFHQYIIDFKHVKNAFEKNGFKYVERHNMTGSLGASREIFHAKDLYKQKQN